MKSSLERERFIFAGQNVDSEEEKKAEMQDPKSKMKAMKQKFKTLGKNSFKNRSNADLLLILDDNEWKKILLRNCFQRLFQEVTHRTEVLALLLSSE